MSVIREDVTGAGTDPTWMRRHLSDSIYIWACGEKADDQDHDPMLSDRLIGWLVLFMQGFAYTMFVVLARANSGTDIDSAADDNDEPGSIWLPVTAATYLFVASTAHDLHSGFSLLVNGHCAGHRAFGIGLLTVYGVMISAAMTVLASTSHDSAAVVLNAVAVIFVADLDEKALKVLLAVPQKWRLFWAIESIGISFALAAIALFYIGDSSHLLEDCNGILKTFPTWFVWALNPAVVTLHAVALSSALQAVCELLGEACEVADEPTIEAVVPRVAVCVIASTKKFKDRFTREPCFYVALMMWLAQAVIPPTSTSGHARLGVSNNMLVLVSSNVMLVIGLAAKALGVLWSRHHGVSVDSAPRLNSHEDRLTETEGSWGHSRVPSLLVGSGIGYWVTSLLYVLGCSLHGADCGWKNAPIIVTMVGYVFIPCVLLAGFFMVVDINFLGTRVGAFITPVVDVLSNKHRVEYWIMVTVFRDFVGVWLEVCGSLRSPFA